MKIKRDQYLDELVSRKHNGLIKVVTGLRRCGKTYLLFTLFKEHLLAEGVDEKHIVEIAFDAFENRQLRDPQVLFPRRKEQLQGDVMHYVLLDEVQLLGDFEAVLNSLIRMKNVDVYAAGSNASHLSKDVITEFRGRGDKVPVHPLSFAEFMSAYQGTKQDGWHEYLTYGGLPQILSCTTPDQKSAFLKSLFEEVYIPDTIERHNIRSKAALEEVVNLLSSAVGSPANPEKLSAVFKAAREKAASSTTIKRYIDCLCDSFLIDSAPRYDVKGKRSVGTSAKYYFTDMGLRNARLNFRQTAEAPCMENIIFNDLKRRGFAVDAGVVTRYGANEKGRSTRRQLEIDFVCNKGSRRYYIQSACTISDPAKREQEQRSLRLTGDFFKRVIITKDTPVPHYTEDGMLVMNIYDFLLNEGSLEI